ncbi:unnamed protein product [Acanthosepion pharaonis]|uniref:Uncharacterized protein n=1 Tax=Acanthosepion pharaonis TaxID=158019 RepID=A0A812BMD9_ACAPH|nr:unnamed protein product [Sepia pharaonis]
MFLQDISLVSPEKTELSRIISRKNVLQDISLVSIENRIVSYYLSEECSARYLISLQRKRIVSVLSLGRMFFAKYLISLSLPLRKNILEEDTLVSISIENRIVSYYLSEECSFARYLISLLHRKTELSLYYLSEECSIKRYLISLSIEKTELSRIISRRNVLARYLISLSRENRIVCIISGEECSCKISH